jgi:hypothetical protein
MIKLFHSYQFIPNSTKLKFNKDKHILENDKGEFVLGLIGIPKIPELTLLIEKSLVSKRLSKKSSYKNHTKHNMKIFIVIDKPNLNTFLSTSISNKDKHYLFDIFKKNYMQYDLDYNLVDVICVKQFKNNTPSKVLTLSTNITITMGDFMINMFDRTITPVDNMVATHKITLLLKGGILLSDLSNTSRYTLLTLDFMNPDFIQNINSTKLLILENELELVSWTTFLDKNQFDYVKLTSNNYKNPLPNTIYIINQTELSNKLLDLDLFEHIFIISNNSDIKIVNSNNSYIWYIINSPNNLTLRKMITILNNNVIDKLDDRIFYNIDNLYQLSKLVTPIYNYSKVNKPKSSNILTIDTKLHHFINYSEKIKFTGSSSIKTKASTYCNLCLSTKSTYIETECKHIYCLECYIDHLYFKLKDTPKNVSCGFCRQNIKNTTVNIYSNKFKNNFLKDLGRRVEKYNRIIIYSNNNKRLSFLKEFVKYYKTKELVTHSNMYNLLNENFNKSLLIYDNISNNTFNYIINQLDITNYIFIE